MKRTMILCASVAALSFACSTTPNVDEKDTTETRSGGMIDVHQVDVSSPDGDGGFFSIGADGAVTVVDDSAPLPPGHYTTIAPDGSVTLADGTPFFKLNADGTLTAADGSTLALTIAEDGTATNPDMPKPLTFDAQGNVGEEGIGDFAKVTHVGGEDSARARRAVALAFVSIFVYVEKENMKKRVNEPM